MATKNAAYFFSRLISEVRTFSLLVFFFAIVIMLLATTVALECYFCDSKIYSKDCDEPLKLNCMPGVFT